MYADLYSSTSYVLNYLRPQIMPRTLIYFDEMNHVDQEPAPELLTSLRVGTRLNSDPFALIGLSVSCFECTSCVREPNRLNLGDLMVSTIRQAKDRILQLIAFHAPGAKSLRVRLHRWRGVKIGQGVWIGYQVLLDTSCPDLISFGDNVIISVRAMLIAHFRGPQGITIEDDAFIGPGAIILPNVTIGRGAVVTAGSVVSSSVGPMTVVQGNPARPIATCGVTLGEKTTMGQFLRSLRPLEQAFVCRAGPFEMIGHQLGRATSSHCDITEASAPVAAHGLCELAGVVKRV